jgi:hypothetical protein
LEPSYFLYGLLAGAVKYSPAIDNEFDFKLNFLQAGERHGTDKHLASRGAGFGLNEIAGYTELGE